MFPMRTYQYQFWDLLDRIGIYLEYNRWLQGVKLNRFQRLSNFGYRLSEYVYEKKMYALGLVKIKPWDQIYWGTGW